MTAITLAPLQAGEFELSAGGTTIEQTVLAVGIVLALLAGIAILAYRHRYASLPEQLKHNKSALLAAIAATDLRTRRFARGADLTVPARREEIDALLAAEPPGRDDPTLREGIGEVRRELAERVMPHWLRLPPLARRLLAFGGSVAVWGLLAVSTGALVKLLRADLPALRPLRWPALAITETQAVLDRAGAGVGGAPGADVAWSLALTLVLVLYEWLYAHWYVAAAALGIAALLVTWLERPRDVESDSLRLDLELPRPGRAFAVVAAAVTALWLLVLVGIGAGRFAGTLAGAVDPGIHGLRWGVRVLAVGVIVGGVGASAWAVLKLRRVRPWWRSIRRQPPVARRLVYARLLAVAIAVVVAPLLPVYVMVGLTALPTVVSAFLAADVLIKTLAVVLVATTVVATGYAARDALPTVRDGLRELVANARLRAVLFGRALPMVGVGMTYPIAYAFVRSIPVALAAAVLVGALVRLGYALLLRAKYRTAFGPSGPTPQRRVTIQAAPLSVRGETQFFARIDGDVELLWPERDELVAAIVSVAADRLERGEHDVVLPERHADHARELGILDTDETETKLREGVRKTAFTTLRERGRFVDRDRLGDRLDRFPAEVVDERLGEAEARGNLRLDRETVELLHDPYA